MTRTPAASPPGPRPASCAIPVRVPRRACCCSSRGPNELYVECACAALCPGLGARSYGATTELAYSRSQSCSAAGVVQYRELRRRRTHTAARWGGLVCDEHLCTIRRTIGNRAASRTYASKFAELHVDNASRTQRRLYWGKVLSGPVVPQASRDLHAEARRSLWERAHASSKTRRKHSVYSRRRARPTSVCPMYIREKSTFCRYLCGIAGAPVHPSR
ncbi:hypothetical protein C8Q78DRAFT_580985 [Trametes maxima]|nr:hypothetical protein C8Q78DRAFT_580985 [Trametes maxima]